MSEIRQLLEEALEDSPKSASEKRDLRERAVALECRTLTRGAQARAAYERSVGGTEGSSDSKPEPVRLTAGARARMGL